MFIATFIVSFFIFRQVKANVPSIPVIWKVVDGPLSGINDIDRDELLYNLQFMQNVKTSRQRKFEVFNKIKGNRRLDDMDFKDIEKLGVFVQGVPSYVLRKELDCNKVEIVSFLGKMGLRRKLLDAVRHSGKTDSLRYSPGLEQERCQNLGHPLVHDAHKRSTRNGPSGFHRC
ncbi:uncharacterized protein LOC123680935 [Harmonia axyridis]|uniref:uncharacterized protein LOC123680935 n=1 Tax=Harmonia axyridis TaxID=115357 RepID=UPI001E277268|nr:uncharacterized protein LOC123680935 [Harmonia axyridis]